MHAIGNFIRERSAFAGAVAAIAVGPLALSSCTAGVPDAEAAAVSESVPTSSGPIITPPAETSPTTVPTEVPTVTETETFTPPVETPVPTEIPAAPAPEVPVAPAPAPQPPVVPPAPDTVSRLGDKDPLAERDQALLARFGCHIVADGEWGKTSDYIAQQVQRRLKLEPGGFGPISRQAVEDAVARGAGNCGIPKSITSKAPSEEQRRQDAADRNTAPSGAVSEECRRQRAQGGSCGGN